jgi:predicted nuclease with TOPRIM domain
VSDQDATAQSDNHKLVLTSFGKVPALSLDMSKIREAESRIIEAKMVNPATYADLESAFNEAYRDLKRHLSSIGFALNQAEKTLEETKSDIILDRYPKFLEEKAIKKTQDNADLRKAFMARDPEYSAALDRLNQLKALESNFDGKIKVLENTCRYMRKKMDLLLRSGMSGADYHVTSGRK